MAHKNNSAPKRDDVIRFRAESELKERLNKMAQRKKKKPAELLREMAWELVQADEKTARGK